VTKMLIAHAARPMMQAGITKVWQGQSIHMEKLPQGDKVHCIHHHHQTKNKKYLPSRKIDDETWRLANHLVIAVVVIVENNLDPWCAISLDCKIGTIIGITTTTSL